MSEEAEKYKFEYRHYRPRVNPLLVLSEYLCRRYMRGVTKWKPSEWGGATMCLVYDDGEEPIAMGMAFCCMRDNFSYRLGREIAKGRAFAALKKIPPKKFNGYRLWEQAGPRLLRLKKVEQFYIPA